MNYIIDYKPFIPNDVDVDYLVDLENKIINKESLLLEELEWFLSNLIYLVRYSINPELNDFTYKCDLAQSIIYHYLEKLGVKQNPTTTHCAITNDIEGHNFIVATFNVLNEPTIVLIDATYIQFFKEVDNKESNFIIKNGIVLNTPSPGYFVKKEDYPIVIDFLKKGFGIMNTKLAQIYGDSFYNTKVGIVYSGIRSMPGDIYIKGFLKERCLISKDVEHLNNLGLNIESISDIKHCLITDSMNR